MPQLDQYSMYGFVIITILLFVCMRLYLFLADKYNIIDKPELRSSHTIPTIRGGGVIFVIGFIIYWVQSDYPNPYIGLAVLLAAVVSFIDDLRGLPSIVRFSIHFIAVLLIFKGTHILPELDIFRGILVVTFCIGVINAYNFMDGINGITGMYSLAILFPMLLTETNTNLFQLEALVIISVLVFGYYNFRRKAVCFAGDIGSISMAIIILFLIISRIFETSDPMYAALLLVYGIDSASTVIYRLYHGENVLKAHRKHLYQYFSNELKIPHLVVSLAFAVIQFGLSMLIVFRLLNLLQLIAIGTVLILVYWYFRIKAQQLIAQQAQ
jgi:UDP-N-acetylmuramyl pentapeptide phosphotransferase/UDP-N-acetylglucosamine-1-phosphate transferase